MSTHRICFVSPLARPILDPEFRCDFGGAEVRAVHFARGLARDLRFDVSMLLRSYGREEPRRMETLTAYFESMERPLVRAQDLPRNVHLPWNLLKIQLQKLGRSWRKRSRSRQTVASQLRRLMAEIPAEVIACFGVQQYSARVVQEARRAGKQSLLFIAHDQDLDFANHREIAETYGGDAATYRSVVESADHIVCQTPHQQELLQTHFARHGVVIRNPIDLSAEARVAVRPGGGQYILWVGRADTFFKRADLMLELARRCPEVPFVAIMNKRKPAVFDELVAQAPGNVQIVEQVLYQRIESYYANATALLSTSRGEGFPNAFLQAGKYGQPILSLDVDPGDMIAHHGCGWITHGDLDAMTHVLNDVWNQREGRYRQDCSDNIRRYVETFHRQEDRVEELGKAILAMTGSESRVRAA